MSFTLPANRGSRTAGAPYAPPPAKRRRSAADPAEFTGLARLVRSLRRRGVPWAHVAQQIGKPEAWLREKFAAPATEPKR